MKNILIIAFTFFTALQLVAQERVEEIESLDDTEVYTIVHQKAEPEEGTLEF